MPICPACGEDNPLKFRLCGYCGAALTAAAPVLPLRETRKTVTVLFCDLKDSTALAGRIDTEALHELKERYYGAMAAQIAHHGGKVEKYIGDAIMAVFGLPRAHEDDALRAVRAAQGMRSALDELNAELRRRYGVALANRTGINTGEVVANDDPKADQKLATGDAVNVAARLEQAAPPDQIYLGEATWRLVRDAVEVEAVEPLELKGKNERVPAWRLVAATGQDGNRRRVDTPLAGRDDELALLAAAWDEVCKTRSVRLVTVVGDAGLGKSRLIHELTARRGAQATVLRGRCLPYGDGITFWPLVEMASAHIRATDSADEAQARLRELTGDADVAARLAAAIGLSATAYPLHELYWAARRFLQRLAQQQPVIALIDDIHWAEPAFLALLEHVLDAATDSPILLLASARHELIEEHPDWPGRDNAQQLQLQPLSTAAASKVVTNLLGGASLPPAVVARIVAAAEGNPLYVEQMLSMLADNSALQHDDEASGLAGMAGLSDEPGAEIVVPPTIRALLEARLDGLKREERATVEPAAVVGVTFERAALESLAADALRPTVAQHLSALHRKQFIEPAGPGMSDAAFRFHHHLIRDTVYHRLLKRTRAQLHTAFVRWADATMAGRDRALETAEILGWHLEQAHRCLAELGPLDDSGIALGREGAERLSQAGRRALARGDMHAAANLFRRAVALLADDDPQRAPLLPELAEALMELGDFDAAREHLAQADRLGDRRVQASAKLIRLLVRLHSGEPGSWSEETRRLSSDTIPLLEADGAHNELAQAWRLIALTHQVGGRLGPAGEAIAKVVEHARRAGNQRLLARSGLGLSFSALYGPTPAGEAIVQCQRILADGLVDRQVVSLIECKLAQLHAMRGDFAAARTLLARARAVLRELGQGVHAASTALDLAVVEHLAGDVVRAEHEVRADYRFLEQRGETYFLSTLASLLARLVREQQRHDEAFALTHSAESNAADDDVDAQVLWRATRAPLLAAQGRAAEGETLARDAVARARATDVPILLADALCDLGTVLHGTGRGDAARAALAEAAALYAAKGDVVSAARTGRLAER